MYHQEDGNSKKLRHLYQCPNHKGKTCTTKDINADYIESYVLDIVLNIVNSTNITNIFNDLVKEDINYIKGMITKNNTILKEKNKVFDSIVLSIDKCGNNNVLANQFAKRLEKLSEEIDSYENKIKDLEVKIKNLQIDTLTHDITKEDLLCNRTIARSIINYFVKEIVVDENNDSIDIELY